jgi:hypothetical protein
MRGLYFFYEKGNENNQLGTFLLLLLLLLLYLFYLFIYLYTTEQYQ